MHFVMFRRSYFERTAWLPSFVLTGRAASVPEAAVEKGRGWMRRIPGIRKPWGGAGGVTAVYV